MMKLDNIGKNKLDAVYQLRAKAASHRQGNCNDISFDSQEQKAFIEKIKQQIILHNELAGLIIFSPANFSYATCGMILPNATQQSYSDAALVVLPKGRRVILCQSAYVDLLREQGWKEDILCFGLNSAHPECGLLEELLGLLKKEFSSSDHLGYEAKFLPVSFIKNLHENTEYQWVDVSSVFEHLRMIKSPKEIALITEAVRQADRGLVSALNHSEGNLLDSWGYSMWEFAERIRVHIGEMGGHGAGQISVVQGSDTEDFAAYPKGNLVQGNFLRTEISNHFRGYWSVGGQTMQIGLASPEHKAAYQKNIFLKKAGIALLKPGARCCDIFTSLCELAKKEGITAKSEYGFGHGIGLAEFEAPYLNFFDETILVDGMVLVLSIYTCGVNREMISSKEVVVITRDGNELLNWYRNWDDLYEMTGNTARHG
jgi:Xaa-Pro aminopeptidase